MGKETGIFPRFFLKEKEHKAASREKGRPVYRDVEYVEIIIAGDKHTNVIAPVNPSHRERFPEEYQRFLAGLEQKVDGTSIKQWPVLTPAQVQEFLGLGILTIEALAELPDTALRNLGMGAMELRAKAKAWLESAENNALAQKQASEIEDLQKQITALQLQLTEQANQQATAKPAGKVDPVPEADEVPFVSALEMGAAN